MSLPANIRVNASVPFPAQVKGAGPVTISRVNGIWTISLGVTQLGVLPAGFDPTKIEVPVYNTVNQVWQQASIQQILALATSTPTVITVANSPYVPRLTDVLIYVDSSGGPVEIDLAPANSRIGTPLTIKDVKGFSVANNITIKPSVGETLDGYTNANPLLINANYGGFRLNPYNNSYVIAP